MRKLLFITLGLSALTVSAQQHVFDFEDLTISPDTYWDGTASHPAGTASSSYQFGDAMVSCTGTVSEYNGIPYASGMGYSNKTDLSTQGFANAGSAYHQGGTGGSTVFGIVSGEGTAIKFAEPVRLLSIDITNTVYAYLSMKNGDAIAKRFGGADGTDADYFKLAIIAYDADDKQIDSSAFVLADYTAADAQEDFILGAWKTCSLASYQDSVSSIRFYFISSDVGAYGMNTPAYAAIDNISYSTYQATAVPTATRCLCSKDGTVSLADAVSIKLYSLGGVLAAQGVDQVSAQGTFIAVAVTADGTVITEQIVLY